MKKLNGFSLMEMMIVLAIVSIVAAASAPMVNRKIVRAASDKSPWVFVNRHGGGESIAYNIRNNTDNKSASIGAVMPPNNFGAPRLYINTNRGTTNPHILFGHNNGNSMQLIAGGERNNLWFSNQALGVNSINSVALGPNSLANETSAIAIGSEAHATGNGAIAIGSSIANDVDRTRANASQRDSIAIGRGAAVTANAGDRTSSIALGSRARVNANSAIAIGTGAGRTNINDSGASSIAIGTGAHALGDSSTALGQGTTAAGKNSVAIGCGARAAAEGSISIGDFQIENTNDNKNRIVIKSGPEATGRGRNPIINNKQIQLGDRSTTVYIPGRLVVDYDAIVNRLDGEFAFRPATTHHDELVWLEGNGDKISNGNIVNILDARSAINTDSVKLFSDRRLKNVGKIFEGGLAELRKLNLYHYTFKDDKDKTPRVGVMAQDLQKIFPDAVVKGEDGFFRIRMEDMFYAVINAVKENDKRITELEKQNAELLKRIEQLEKNAK